MMALYIRRDGSIQVKVPLTTLEGRPLPFVREAILLPLSFRGTKDITPTFDPTPCREFQLIYPIHDFYIYREV